MPSKPRRLRGLVRVTHPKYGEKTVTRAQLRQLSANWSRVPEPRPKRAKKSAEPKTPPPEADTSAPDPAADPDPEPDVTKE